MGYSLCFVAIFGYFQNAFIFVMFKKRAVVFYRVKKHEVQPSGCSPYKGRAASFSNALKTFLKKRVSIDFITIMLSQMLEICIREKHFRTFRKPKSAEEERNLIKNAILKSTRAVTKWSVKKFLEWQNGRKNKHPAIEPLRLRAFTTDKSKVQRLDTDIANMTAESLTFWLKKCLLLILCKSKFTVCEIS